MRRARVCSRRRTAPSTRPPSCRSARTARCKAHDARPGARHRRRGGAREHLPPGAAPGRGARSRSSAGLHAFMRWDGPILTDSGGFQVFSLPSKEISDRGVRFKNEVDGASDGAHARALDRDPERARRRRHHGLRRVHAVPGRRGDSRAPACAARSPGSSAASRAHARPTQQALFGIVQGSVYPEPARAVRARRWSRMDLPGYAIGGVSVGEGHELLCRITEHAAPLLPEDEAPLPDGRGPAGGPAGRDRLRHGPVRLRDPDPLRALGRGLHRARPHPPHPPPLPPRRATRSTPPATARPARAASSRAYLHHLFAANEILSAILASIHNVRFYQRLVADARQAILEGGIRGVAGSVPGRVPDRLSVPALAGADRSRLRQHPLSR